MPFLRKRGERKSLGSFAFDSNENFRESGTRSRKDARRNGLKKHFSRIDIFLDPFYFHTPLFPRVEKWMAVRKRENERKRGAPRFTARLPLLRPPLSQSHSTLRVSTSVSTGDIDYWMSEWLNASVRCNDSGPTAARSWSRLYRSTGLWAFCVL